MAYEWKVSNAGNTAQATVEANALTENGWEILTVTPINNEGYVDIVIVARRPLAIPMCDYEDCDQTPVEGSPFCADHLAVVEETEDPFGDIDAVLFSPVPSGGTE